MRRFFQGNSSVMPKMLSRVMAIVIACCMMVGYMPVAGTVHASPSITYITEFTVSTTGTTYKVTYDDDFQSMVSDIAYQDGDTVEVSVYYDSNCKMKFDATISGSSGNFTWDLCNTESATDRVNLADLPQSGSEKTFYFQPNTSGSDPSTIVWKSLKIKNISSTPDPTPSPSPSGSDKSTTSSGSSTSGKTTVPVVTAPVQVQHACEHSYEWTVSRNATSTEDGEEVLKCTKCGDISARAAIPAFGAFAADARDRIKNAKSGTTVTVDTKLWMSFPRYVIDELLSRPDITLIVKFEDTTDHHAKHSFRLTAANLQNIEDTQWYGFLYLWTFVPQTIDQDL